DPPGLREEHHQCAADRLVQPDLGRFQRGGGQQPGAVDPPVDRGLRARARQPVAAERAQAPAVSGETFRAIKTAGAGPRRFSLKPRWSRRTTPETCSVDEAKAFFLM